MNNVYRLAGILVIASLAALTACQPAETKSAPAVEVASDPNSEPDASNTPGASAPFTESTLFARFDQKTDAHLLTPVDPASGLPVDGLAPVSMGANYAYRLSIDGRTLIFLSYPDQTGGHVRVRFLDLATWTETPGLELPTDGWAPDTALSSDGTRLAFVTAEAHDRTLWLVDVRKHVLIESADTPLNVTAIEFTADGQALMLYGVREDFNTGRSDGPPLAEYRSADDLKLIWSRPLERVFDGFLPNEGYTGTAYQAGAGRTFRPAVVFDRDRAIMYIVHADVEKLTRVEFERSRVLTQDIRPHTALLERLLSFGTSVAYAKMMEGVERSAMLSEDGTVLYIAGVENKITPLSGGEWQFEQEALALQAIDPSTAVEIFRSEAAGQRLHFAPELGSIYVTYAHDMSAELDRTYEVTPTDGAVLNEATGKQLRLTHRMDGTPILVATIFGSTGRTTLSASTLEGVPLGSWWTSDFGDWIIVP